MNSENNFTDIEKAFYSDGYKLGLQAVTNDSTKESINISVSAMYGSIDRLITALSEFASQQNNKIECKKGCAFCCHCSIYDVRPMACRIYLSTNLDSCRRFYQQPEDESNYPALLDFPMRAGRMMNEGFKSALKTKGITARELRIDQLVL